MKKTLRSALSRWLPGMPRLRKMLLFFFPSSALLNRIGLQENFLGAYIRSYYPAESIRDRRFYNIGAGSQRSRYPLWSYVDLRESDYDKVGIDVFFDLEALEPMPLEPGKAEVVFSSFVIEHISVAATKNLCREAFRVLRPGGVFHSKVHSYEYGYQLWKKGLISSKVPFDARESSALVDAFIKKHRGKVIGGFTPEKGYVLSATDGSGEELCFSPADMFLIHNATTAWQRLKREGTDTQALLEAIDGGTTEEFFGRLQQRYVDGATRQPHQHNADYFSKEELFDYIKGLGFSEVYFTQPYQSMAPVLWEEVLNPLHAGFLYAIEAVK